MLENGGKKERGEINYAEKVYWWFDRFFLLSSSLAWVFLLPFPYYFSVIFFSFFLCVCVWCLWKFILGNHFWISRFFLLFFYSFYHSPSFFFVRVLGISPRYPDFSSWWIFSPLSPPKNCNLHEYLISKSYSSSWNIFIYLVFVFLCF